MKYFGRIDRKEGRLFDRGFHWGWIKLMGNLFPGYNDECYLSLLIKIPFNSRYEPDFSYDMPEWKFQSLYFLFFVAILPAIHFPKYVYFRRRIGFLWGPTL